MDVYEYACILSCICMWVNFLKYVIISARMFSILRNVVPKASLRGNEAN